MKICPSCGRSMEDDARFCENCGAALPDETPQAVRFCFNCGQKLTADAMFCPYCGTAAQKSAPPAEQPPAENPSSAEEPVPPTEEPTSVRTAEETVSIQPVEEPTPVPPAEAIAPSGAVPPAPSQPGSFCSYCGERLPAGSTFCPNCGTVIQASASGAKGFGRKNPGGGGVKPVLAGKPNKGVLIAAVAAAAVVVAIAAFILLPKLFHSPAKTFVSVQEETLLAPLLSAMEREMDTYGSGKFSTDITVTGSADMELINRYLSDSSLALKVDMSESDLLLNGDLVMMGSPVFSGTVTYEKGRLGVYLPEFDDSYYTMDLSAVMERWAGADDVDLSDLKVPEFSGKEWRALSQTYLDLVYTVVNRKNVEVEKREDFRLSMLGESCTGTIYTFRPTQEDVQAMLEKLADHLEKDQELRKLIAKVINSQSLQNAIGSTYGYDSLDEYLESALLEAADSLRENAEDLGAEVERSGFTWELYMEGKELRMVRINSSYDGDSLVFEREGTESKKCEQVLYLATSYGETEVYFRNEYSKKGKVYDGELSFDDGYGDSCNVRYNMDTGKLSVLGVPYGSYDLRIPDEDVVVKLEVSDGKSGSTDHQFSVYGDGYAFGQNFSRVNATVNTTNRSSAKKSGKKATDITNYTDQELEELLYGLSNRIEAELGSLMYELFW